ISPKVADKLLSSFGQDILDALFWTATEPRGKKREHLGVVPHLAMAIGYVCTFIIIMYSYYDCNCTLSEHNIGVHSILVLFQATTLNVAINSKNKALLTVMLSNNVSN